jgi:hypothetical protein
MTITVEQLVSREVGHCVSSLVSTLAGSDYPHGADDLGSLMDQAQELAAPVPDYESAAVEDGWSRDPHTGDFHHKEHGHVIETAGWQGICEGWDIEPYDREVFEHWIVSDWLADELIKHGEKVDKDFAGLCVWARTTSGQAIYADSVIEDIHAELTAP